MCPVKGLVSSFVVCGSHGGMPERSLLIISLEHDFTIGIVFKIRNCVLDCALIIIDTTKCAFDQAQ